VAWVLVERWERRGGALVMRKSRVRIPQAAPDTQRSRSRAVRRAGVSAGISPARRRIGDRPGRVLSGGEFGFAGLGVAVKAEMASGMGQE
jgi:hypothetical protein